MEAAMFCMFLHVGCAKFNCPGRKCCHLLGFFFLFLSSAGNAQADFVHLRQIAGTPDGEFGWDVFSGNYAGPHAPDVLSSGGMASLSAAPAGGIITSTQNLYSFFTTPTWQFSMNDLKHDLAFSSVAIQLVASGNYSADQFLLDGQQPAEFFQFGQVTLGGFDTRFYWAEWQGLTSASRFTANLAAPDGAQHLSLAAAKISYFNTSTVYDIQAIPEPSVLGLGQLLVLVGLVRRRR
jgi:hypothetical protein